MKSKTLIFSLIVISFFLSSCQRTKNDNSTKQVYCKDTSLVWVCPACSGSDTVYRLTYNSKKIQDGDYIIYYDIQMTLKAHSLSIKKNKPIGNYKHWRRDGTLMFEGENSLGKDTCYHKTFYPNKNIQEYYRSVQDTIVGDILEYYESGQLKTKTHFVNGQRVIINNYYLNGQISQIEYIKKSSNWDDQYGNARVEFDSLGNYKGTYKLYLDLETEIIEGIPVTLKVLKGVNIDSLKK